MQKLRFLSFILLSVLLVSCQQEETTLSSAVDDQTKVVESSINQSEEVDGVRYTFKNVSLNPDLIVLNEGNSHLKSIKGDTYQLDVKESSVDLSVGNIIYLQADGKSYLLKINSLEVVDNNLYTFQAEAAGLGYLFQSGSLELSVDVDKAQNLVAEKRASTGSTAVLQSGVSFDILDYIKPFESKNFTANLNSSLKAYFNIKMSFGSSHIMPNMLEVSYELHPSINPYFTSAKGANGNYRIDYADYVSSNISEAVKSIDLSVDIPLGDLGTLPAKIGIEKISIPSEFTANVSEEMNLHFNTSGFFKIGYVHYNDVPGKISHMIYENSMIASNVDDIKLNGELSSQTQIIIKPRISLVDNNLIQVGGELSFGLTTLTAGGISTTTNEFVGGSVGKFESKGGIKAGSLGLNVFNVDLVNQTKELWNIGSFNKEFIVSDFRVAKPSKTQCSLRSYSFDITAEYKYPVYGKRMTQNIEVTYDVYDDRKSLLSSGQKASVEASSVTDKNFTFSLCVPFRVNALGFTTGLTRNTAYLRNIKITDALGNVAQGPSEIALNSPYNTSFWK